MGFESWSVAPKTESVREKQGSKSPDELKEELYKLNTEIQETNKALANMTSDSNDLTRQGLEAALFIATESRDAIEAKFKQMESPEAVQEKKAA